MLDRLSEDELEILALERQYFSLVNRYGYFEILIELALSVFKGFLSSGGRDKEIDQLVINPEPIKRLYGKSFPDAQIASIRELSGIPIIDKRVSLQSLLNMLHLRFSPSLAIYRSWKKRTSSIDTIICGTDHPYIFAFLLATKMRTRQVNYYQHGFYPDKFYHKFSYYDFGFTIFKDSWEYLKTINPSRHCSLVPLISISSRNASQGSLIVVALPDFEFGDMDKAGMFEHVRTVISELVLIHGKEYLILRPHPLNPPSNKWIRGFVDFNVPFYRDPIQSLLEKTKTLILILPSTLKYEAEAMGIEVLFKPPQTPGLVKYEISF